MLEEIPLGVILLSPPPISPWLMPAIPPPLLLIHSLAPLLLLSPPPLPPEEPVVFLNFWILADQAPTPMLPIPPMDSILPLPTPVQLPPTSAASSPPPALAPTTV